MRSSSNSAWGGIKLDTSKIGRVDGTTLADALTSEAGETAMAALKSARDQLNRPGQTQLMLVMSGSRPRQIAAPFYGSQIQRMPELGPNFVAHIAKLIIGQRPDLIAVNQATLLEAFALYGQRPQFFMEALGQVLSPPSSHTVRFEDALLIQAAAQLRNDEAQMESDYTTLRQLEQAVLWRMLALGTRFRPAL